MSVPVPYQADHAAQRILLEAARRHTVGRLAEMARRYFVKTSELRPAAFYRMTDNWLELTARFVAPTHAIRELKDAMTRKILKGMRHAGIRVASTTIEIAVP